MAKKRVKKNRKIQLDPGEFLHQPHDKYVRFVMQSKEMALALLGFCMPSECFASIDWEKFDLSTGEKITSRFMLILLPPYFPSFSLHSAAMRLKR